MITVTISREELEAADACEGGLELFGQISQGLDTITVEWTQLAQVWLSVAYPEFARWLYNQGFVPLLSLYGANLGGADLYGANLGGANLGGAYLYGADLEGWERGPDGYARRKAQ